MLFVRDLAGGNPTIQRDMTVYDSSSLAQDAALIKGTTPGTDGSAGIVAAGALVNVIGVLQEAVTSFGAIADGTMYDDANLREVIINPLGVFRAEYDQVDDADVASSSTTTVTITSLEDNIDGGWLYAVSGTGAYKLAFIGASASGSCTTLSSTGWDSTTDVIKLLPRNHELVKILAAGTGLGTDAAAGTGRAWVINNFVKSNTVAFQALQPALHDDLTLDATASLYADICFQDHIASPLT